MIKPNYLLVYFFILLLSGVNSYASESPESGFTGLVVIGGGYTDQKLSSDDASENKNYRITSLERSSLDNSEFFPIMHLELRYTFKSTDTAISLGSGEELGSSEFSITQYCKKLGVFSFEVEHLRDHVWEDSFVIHSNRRRTDRDSITFSVSWDEIMNSNFIIYNKIKTIDVENDVAGERDHSLEQKGDIYTFGIGSSLFENNLNKIIVNAEFTKSDLLGKSNAYKGYGLEFVHILNVQGWDIETSLCLSSRGYDEIHPAFNKTRDENELSLESTFTLHEPFGWKSYFIALFGSYNKNDSNINFYDSSGSSAGMAIGYAF